MGYFGRPIRNGLAIGVRSVATLTSIAAPAFPPPVAPPGAVTGASAVGGNTQATVSFTLRPGAEVVTSYTATSTPGGITATGGSSPIVVTGLTNGTAYTFTVFATNVVGNGPASAATNAVTPFTVPAAPTSPVATAGNATASIAFTAPSNGGSAITGYTATSSPGNLTGTNSVSPVVVNGLTNGTAYTFTVVATNAAGNGPSSVASNSVTPVASVSRQAQIPGGPYANMMGVFQAQIPGDRYINET